MATILVVKNHNLLQGMIYDFLENLEHTVLIVNKGEEAIEASVNYQGMIHIMLTDLTLPDMTGVRLVNHMAALRPHMASVLMSTSPLLDDIQPDDLPPNTSYLHMPFKLNVLKNMLYDRLLGRWFFNPTCVIPDRHLLRTEGRYWPSPFNLHSTL